MQLSSRLLPYSCEESKVQIEDLEPDRVSFGWWCFCIVLGDAPHLDDAGRRSAVIGGLVARLLGPCSRGLVRHRESRRAGREKGPEASAPPPISKHDTTSFRDKKSMAMAMFKRKFARTLPDNLRAPHIKMWGFEAKRARNFTRTLSRTLPYFFHYHAFFFPDSFQKIENYSRTGFRQNLSFYK